jgi:exopolyphosphatase/guanosine-5'-triphosphate,3'-diphosphate pyrophosphatase
MRVAVHDLGSNSFHLLVAEADPVTRALEPVECVKNMVRLGSGTLESGFIDATSWTRGLAALDELASHAHRQRPDVVRAVATSALREARNGAAFAQEAGRRLGTTVEIVDGRREAELIYLGASSAGIPDGVMTVIDVGGGSVELAVGALGECTGAFSLPLGVLRLREALLPTGGALSEPVARAVADRVRSLAAGAAQAVRSPHVVLTSGTARALASLIARLDGLPTPAGVITCAQLARAANHITRLDRKALAELGVEDARTDTIAVGAVVVLTLLELVGADSARVVDRALREGVVVRETRVRVRSGEMRPSDRPHRQRCHESAGVSRRSS